MGDRPAPSDALAAIVALDTVRFVRWGERTTAACVAAAQALGLRGV